jgi:hypothetical protein
VSLRSSQCSCSREGCAYDAIGTDSPGTRAGLPWLQSPEAYAQDIAAADRSRRTRERQDAVEYFLREPRAESAVRLHLVFAAAVQEVDEAHEALDQIASARAVARSPFAQSVLTSVEVGTQQHLEDQRAVLAARNELTVERSRREQLERALNNETLSRQRVQQALDEVQEKLRAVLSIEQQLQEDEAF